MRLAVGSLSGALALIAQGACAQEFTETRIVETTVTKPQPRITEAPFFARKLGSNKWDTIHEAIQARKRDASVCPSDYQLCPESLNGGCCPNDRSCGMNSCYATTSAPALACGLVGYTSCAVSLGGSCCPSNWGCVIDGCTPLPGVVNTETCGPNSYLCPASVNFGCCHTGLACGITTCYSTAVETFTSTATLTTTKSGVVITYTSKSIERFTPTVPSFPALTGTIPQIKPTVSSSSTGTGTPTPIAIAKTDYVSSGGGLTKPQLDGIIAGAVVFLVIILAVAFVIVFHLNKVKKAIEASSKSYRSYRSGTQTSRSRHKTSQTQSMVVRFADSRLMDPGQPKDMQHPSHPSPIHVTAYEVDASPHLMNPTPNTPLSPPLHHTYAGGYAPVATSEPQSPPFRHRASDSLTSHPPNIGGPAVIPPDIRDQNLRFGRHASNPRTPRPSQHGRQWSGGSNASELSSESAMMSEADTYGSISAVEGTSPRAFIGFGWIRRSFRQPGSE